MKISIIIPTYKRKKRVLETIKSFFDQTYQEFEMVVVDQGPARIFDEEISNLNAPFPIKYVYLSGPNLCKARNAGIQNACGQILLFCDDDIVPDKSLVEKHMSNYNDDNVGGVGGRIISSGRRRELLLFFKFLHPTTGSINPLDASLICNFHRRRRCEVKHVGGCNMSFRREALIRAGLFDESFGGTAVLEETDMSFRVRGLGYRLIFEPNAVVKHLELTYGGCQTEDFNSLIYWLYYTDTLVYMRYFRRITLFFFLARMLIRMSFYILFKMDYKIFDSAKKGYLNGLKRYREEERLET